MHKKILSIDIETRSDVDLPKHGVYNYVNTPHFKILWFSYSYDYGPVHTIDLWHDTLPDSLIRDIQDPDVLKCAANATFERICLSRFLGVYLDPIQWTCTLVLAGRNGLPMHLDGAAAHSRVHIQKDASGKEGIETFSIPQQITKANPWRQWINPEHEPVKWNDYGKYNNIDVAAEMEVKKANMHIPVSRVEDMLYTLDQQINDRGIMIDRVFVQQAMQIGARFKQEVTDRVIELTGIKNPNSVQQLVKWLNTETDLEPVAKLPGKAVLKLVEKLDAQIAQHEHIPQIYLPNETVSKMLVRTPPEVIKEVLECRLMLGKASISKYTAMNKVVGWDDRVRGFLLFYGASRTGRWAGRGVQPHNMTKHKTEQLNEMRAAIRSGNMELVRSIEPNVASALSQCVRTSFIAKPGHTFLISDYSAIEARVAAWLADEQWRLDFFHRGGDIYIESAARMYHVDPRSIDKKTHAGAQMRARGKVAELALGFGGAEGALFNMGEQLGLVIPEQERRPIVDAWRQASPAICDCWTALEYAAIRAILQPGTRVTAGKTGRIQYLYKNGHLYCILPSGRWLSYRDAHIGTNRFGKPGIFYYEAKNKQWQLSDTFGGKLFENCVQAIARDLLCGGMLRLDHAGFDIVLHVHDEVVLEEPLLGRTIDEVNWHMTQKSAWYQDLPFGAAGFVSPYYKKDDN